MNESRGEGSVGARPHGAYEQGEELDLDQRHWEPRGLEAGGTWKELHDLPCSWRVVSVGR